MSFRWVRTFAYFTTLRTKYSSILTDFVQLKFVLKNCFAAERLLRGPLKTFQLSSTLSITVAIFVQHKKIISNQDKTDWQQVVVNEALIVVTIGRKIFIQCPLERSSFHLFYFSAVWPIREPYI